MNITQQRSTMTRAGLWALPLLLLVSQMGQAQSSLTRDDFMQVSLQGFDGDRQNGYAWAMQWFNGNLLVGTDRAQNCTNAAQDHEENSADPYPPTDPDISARRLFRNCLHYCRRKSGRGARLPAPGPGCFSPL